MRASWTGIVALASGMAMGCAPPPRGVPAATIEPGTVSDADSADWSSSQEPGIAGAMYDDSGRPLSSAKVAGDRELDEEGRFVSTSIPAAVSIPAAEGPTGLRPKRVGKRDIFLKDAPLDNAFRVLARAGDFNLVVQEGITESVTLELRQVEPYDAALVLAEANHLSMRYQDGIVVVGRPEQK